MAKQADGDWFNVGGTAGIRMITRPMWYSSVPCGAGFRFHGVYEMRRAQKGKEYEDYTERWLL